MQHIIISATNEAGPNFWTILAKTTSGKEVPVAKVGKASADYSLITYRLNYLVGRLLTQMDASLADPVQRKALKDVIRGLIADEFGFYAETLERKTIEDSLADIEKMDEKEFLEWCKENPPVGISDVIAPEHG